MGRGLGQMQQSVLEIMREDAARAHHYSTGRQWMGLRAVARKVAGRDLDPELLNADHSLIESVRRAVKTLERRGMVETGYLWYETRDPMGKMSEEVNGSGLHLQLTADEWNAAPCRLCTIGPCVGPVNRSLLHGSRHPDYACGLPGEDPVAKLQAALRI